MDRYPAIGSRVGSELGGRTPRASQCWADMFVSIRNDFERNTRSYQKNASLRQEFARAPIESITQPTLASDRLRSDESGAN